MFKRKKKEDVAEKPVVDETESIEVTEPIEVKAENAEVSNWEVKYRFLCDVIGDYGLIGNAECRFCSKSKGGCTLNNVVNCEFDVDESLIDGI